MADNKTTIPAPPWTAEALGEELYVTLAKENGCYDPSSRPDLDLTTPYKQQQEAAKASAKPARGAEKE